MHDDRTDSGTAERLMTEARRLVAAAWRPARHSSTPAVAGMTLALMLVLSCGDTMTPGPDAPDAPDAPDEPAVLIGAGDICMSIRDADSATAAVLDQVPDAIVFTTGDNLHDNSPDGEYDVCYGPTWGRHKGRTYPAVGNHDYDPGSSDPYFDYFGPRAGPRGKGYYSFAAGSWHVIVLNSNADHVATAAGSEQEQWLRRELEMHRETRCIMAIWHHPRFYQHASWNKNFAVLPFWHALYEAGADVVVNGHFHLYERYGRQDPNGDPDPERGIRQFTVGTAGRWLDQLHPPAPNLEVRNNETHGVLKFELTSGAYRWEFVPAHGGTFTDSGTAECH